MLWNIGAALALAAVAPTAFAQAPDAAGATYPTRSVRLLVPFPPGSASDILARLVGERLAAGWGHPVVVENRPGAGGTIGTGAAARAEPDGYTLVIVSAGHVVNPQLYPGLPYDPLRDFAGVIPLGAFPSVLTVTPTLGVRTVQDLVALAKARPGSLNFASGGIGSGSHVSAEKFRAATGIDVVHVPLKGAQEMVTETMTGRTQFGFNPIIATLGALREGKLVALAVSSSKRAEVLPDVPTMAEAGVPAAEFNFWIGLLAPAKTPREVVRRLNAEIGRTLESPPVRERLARMGAEPLPMTPEQFDAFMRQELASLSGVLKPAGDSAK
jgi:tripartite-type tricarboxylate transporter receptor subunit TctC